jgi:cathepsin X
MFKVAAVLTVGASAAKFATLTKGKNLNELWTVEQEASAGVVRGGSHVISPLPQDTILTADLPDEFNWGNKDGVNYLTANRNQHLPQYCGSCWAHGAVSSLGDRIKIARDGKGVDINLSVQHMLNCGTAGSCHGGSVDGPFQWIHQISQKTGTGISYETANPYLACSTESDEGFCGSVNTKCNDLNVARTCSTFSENGGKCVGLTTYPNATVSEYGSISGADAMQKEIFARGPISCGIDASYILQYTGGIAADKGDGVDHVISVVGWGVEDTTSYWIVRNSWGEYWGEMGYLRVEMGNNALKMEEQCAWAVPGAFTEANFPCYEGGENCM